MEEPLIAVLLPPPRGEGVFQPKYLTQRRKGAKNDQKHIGFEQNLLRLATILRLELSLPFKGRVGVGMGYKLAPEHPHPPPLLPLEGRDGMAEDHHYLANPPRFCL